MKISFYLFIVLTMKVFMLIGVMLSSMTPDAYADFASDLMGLGLPAQLADKIGNNFEYNIANSSTAKLKIGGTTRLQASYDPIPPNIEIYAGTTDGADSQYLYLQGGGGPIVNYGERGAILELAGNEVTPSSSQGRAQLFSGNVPNGKIGLNVTHASGEIVLQSEGTGKLTYAPATGVTTLYTDINFLPSSGTKTFILDPNIVVNATSAVLRLPNGTGAPPATCTIGEIYADSNSNDCANGAGDGALCICKATNTWALLVNY